MFRKYTKMNKVSSMDTDTPSWVARTEQGHDDGAIFLSNFPPTTTQEELSEVERKYKQFVMRMPFALLSLSQASGLSERTYYHRSWVWAPVFHKLYSNGDHVEEILSVHRRVSMGGALELDTT
jgi:hypothetical protein